MSKRHNRKRTRSRPRHRDGGKTRTLDKTRIDVFDPFSISSRPLSSSSSSFGPFSRYGPLPPTVLSTEHWQPAYSVAWHQDHRLRMEMMDQQRRRALEAQRLWLFGGEAGDESCLLEPMLKVVTDLFDGNIDYVDP